MDKPTCGLKRKIWVLLYTQYMENISTRRYFGYARIHVRNVRITSFVNRLLHFVF